MTQRKLIRGCQAHIAAGLGCGADYVAATGTPLFAPKDGTIAKQYTGNEGGKWLWFTDKAGNSLQFAHLSAYVGGLRTVKEGELIAKTGNTGSITTGPHLHVQILKGTTRLDPEQYNWVDNPPPPANTGGMGLRFPIFREKSTGKIYFRIFELPVSKIKILQHVPNPTEKERFWPGVVPEEVDDIRTIGTPLEDIVAEKDALSKGVTELKTELAKATKEHAEIFAAMSTEIATLKAQLLECGEPPWLTGFIEGVKERIK